MDLKLPLIVPEEKLQKSYYDVLGLCCSSEVKLIEKILNPLNGIKDVKVVVPTKTVIVTHDQLIIPQLEIAALRKPILNKREDRVVAIRECQLTDPWMQHE
ncbi:hypothetical protein LIER_37154 [Lithospermum erythrorhizon]|uniref:HMA domain-containing protein n=1 Tax=Lithospermum erythrorhizon TaxID=34254 RepID=A0AAV3PG40_LITER